MTGVRKGKAQDDKGDESVESNTIAVHIGVFFDGTGNSMMNVKERKLYDKLKEKYSKKLEGSGRDEYYKKNDSHGNDLSNVAIEYVSYQTDESSYKFSVYIEGIGTAPRPVDKDEEFKATVEYYMSNGNYGDDVILGQGLGYGKYGVNAKIERGVEKITSCLLKIKNKIEEDSDSEQEIQFKLTFDVFGFSRGAAAARSFTSRIKSPKGDTYKFTASQVSSAISRVQVQSSVPSIYQTAVFSSSTYNSTLYKRMEHEYLYGVCLMDELNANDIKMSEPIKVNFLGLYDTVSSYGLNHEDDVEELALTIDKDVVDNVFQICAADEYRKNFSLTLVDPFENNFIIPGAHSDIGGGYSVNPDNPEKLIIYEKKYTTLRVLSYLLFDADEARKVNESLRENIYAGNKSLQQLVNEGWYTLTDVEHGQRLVNNTYQYIALKMMVDKCDSSKFKIKEKWQVQNKGLVTYFYNYIKSKKLYKFDGAPGNRKIKRIVSEVTKLEKKIRNQYLHLSAKGGENLSKLLLSPDTFGIGFDRVTHAAQPGNIRKIIENQ